MAATWPGASKFAPGQSTEKTLTRQKLNPESDQFWPIDYRLYVPDGDGKSKLGHVHDMLDNVVHHKRLPFHAV
jgi:hypothetical protein